MTPRKTSKPTLESDLSRLEKIVEALEAGSVPLDDAVSLYEEGIALSRACADRLRATELRIKKLTKDLEGQFWETDLDSE
jgi:exodeoxyribonuclease VII small subunit